MSSHVLNILPGSPALSALTWVVIAVLVLYLARMPAHRAIRSLCRVFYKGMRMAARSVSLAEQSLLKRNKEVLMASGRESLEHLIEREFHRVDAVVKRDLSAYPALQRDLMDQVTRIDEDYRESAELTPPPPAWVNAVKGLSKIPFEDATAGNIFRAIHKTINAQYKNVVNEYRKSTAERHRLLKKMMPYWRRLTQSLEEVDKTIIGLQERAAVIDKKMDEYEEVRAQTDKAERVLTASSMTQFVISGLVLLIAFGGILINFNLIALPMSEMVGGGSYIGQFKTSNVAALVIILVEVAMGLYLMESMRVTCLFPTIGAMDDRLRKKMVWITFSILLILACVESSLAFMRDRIAADMQALRQSLAGSEQVMPTTNWIPTVGQMVMGFIFPFALTFVAIPLESFVTSSRTVLGASLAAFLRGLAFFLRLLGSMSAGTAELMVSVYDLLIVPPLWVERLFRERGESSKIDPQEETL